MICTNELTDLKCHKNEILEKLVILLASYAPHISEELWQVLGDAYMKENNLQDALDAYSKAENLLR